MRSGIVGEKDNLVTMHDILDAQWVYDNTKVRCCSMLTGMHKCIGSQNRLPEALPCGSRVSWATMTTNVSASLGQDCCAGRLT